MGSVAQAVVEFDEAVQAPWRPPLAGARGRRAQLRAVPDEARRRPAHGAGPGREVPGPAHHRPPRPAGQPRRPVPTGPQLRQSSARPGGDASAAPALRFTRRARRLGAVLGLAVGVAVGSWLGSALAGDGDGLRLVGQSSVVVHQGDTLWSIAAGVAGDEGDIRAVVAGIRELNGLADASLVPGQVLVLP